MRYPTRPRPQRSYELLVLHEKIYEIQRIEFANAHGKRTVEPHRRSRFLTRTTILHPRRRHKLQATARHKEARDVSVGPNLSSYHFLHGPSSRAQTNCQIRSTDQKGVRTVQNFEFHQNPVFPCSGITLEPVYDKMALRVMWNEEQMCDSTN